MARLGMDLDALYEHSSRLQRLADDMKRAQAEVLLVAGTLTKDWGGVDADRHRQLLMAEVPRLNQVQKVLEDAAQSLRRAADEQRMISSW